MWQTILSMFLGLLGQFLKEAVSEMIEKRALNKLVKKAKEHALFLMDSDLENGDRWVALKDYMATDARLAGVFIKENAADIIGKLAVAAAKKEVARRLAKGLR
jgi:hypothetical protein